MGDLISRSALIEYINSRDFSKRFVQSKESIQEILRTFIDEQPTAYSVDKVVAEIQKKHCQKCRNILGVAGAEEYCKEQKCEIDELCDIVKRGGVE